MRVVRATAQLNVLYRRLAARCEWFDVMQLEPSPFAASAFSPHKRAASFVARPHSAPHGSRYQPRSLAGRLRLLSRMRHQRQLSFFVN